MFSFFSFEIKRLTKNRVLLILYLLFLLAAILVSYTYDLSAQKDYKSIIIVIDEDDSEKSRMLISHLNKGTAIKTVEYSGDEDAIISGKASAILKIPKGFFEELPNSKITYICADGDMLAPALIDIIAQGFVADVVEKNLINKVEKTIGEDQAEVSLEEYDDLRKETMFDLRVNEDTIEEQKGLLGSVKREMLDGAAGLLLYLAAFAGLFVVVPLNISAVKEERVLTKLRLSAAGAKRYFLSKRLVDYIIVLLPSFISAVIVFSKIGMAYYGILYYLFALAIVLIFVYELTNFINYSITEAGFAFFSVLFVVIFLTIIGGAFFAFDMFPKWIMRLSSLSPFGVLGAAFYGGVNSSFGLEINMGIYFVLSILILGLNYRRLTLGNRIFT